MCKNGISMKSLRFVVATATMLCLSCAAMAGGLSPEIMEAPVLVEDEMAAPAASSVSPALIVLGVLGALLLATSLGDDDDDGSSSTTTATDETK